MSRDPVSKCDSPTCAETCARGDMRVMGWMSVLWESDVLYFCSWDCAIRYGLGIPVTED